MNNNTSRNSVIGLACALAFSAAGFAQGSKIGQIGRANLLKKPTTATFSTYYSKMAAYSSKVSSTGRQTLATQNNSQGRSEVVVNVPPSITPVRENGTPTTRRNGNLLCEAQGYSLDYVNAGIFNNLERSLPSTIFPGAFIDARTMLSKRPASYVAANRLPLNVAISINDRADVKKFTATSFGSNYEQELHAQLRNASFGTNIPAFMIMQTTEVNSVVEIQASLNLTVGIMLPLEEFGIPAEFSQGISGSASGSSGQTLRTYIITYEQPMYDYTVKENERSLFFSSPGMAEQHPNAALVRSVVYGRRIVIMIKSQEDAATVSATVRQRLGLNVSGGDLAGFTLGSKIDASVVAKFDRQIKSFSAVVQGGSAALANRILSDPTAIKNYIEDPNAAVLRSGTGEVPIQYVLERVSADVVLGVRSTANFQAEACVEPSYKVELVYKGLKCHKVVEGPNDDKEDIFGTCSVNGQLLLDIGENSATSIAAGSTSADIRNITLISNIKPEALSGYIITFVPNFKDWEPFHKPEFKLAQPLDGKYQLNTNRLNKIFALNQGQSVILDSGTEEMRVYENGDKTHASISVQYQVKVTRN